MAITRFNAKNGLSVGTGSIGVVDSEGNVEAKNIGVTGSITPDASGLYDLGSPTKGWRNLYVSNISGSLTGSNVSAGQVVVAGTGGVLSGSNNFWWSNSNNRVGIGTSSPMLGLEVRGTPGNPATSGATQSNGVLRLRTNTGNSQTLDFGIFDTGNYGGWIQATNSGDLSSNSPLSLNPNGGGVGIGTTTAAGTTLVVQGSSSATETNMYVRGGNANPTGGANIFNVQNSVGTSILMVSGSGKVGINAVPNVPSPLIVFGNVNFPQVTAVGNSGANPNGIAGYNLKIDTTDLWQLITDNNSSPANSFFLQYNNASTGRFLAVTSVGNVGIGTTVPNSTAGYTTLTVGSTSTGGRIDFNQGSSAVGSIYNDSGALYVQGNSSEVLVLGANASEAMRINTSLNVGIGTATPAAMLTVSGTIVTKYNNGLEGYIAAGTYSAGTAGFYPFSNLAVSLGYGSNDTIVKYGAGNNSFIVLHGSTPSFSVNGSDNVSIGPSSYTARLFVSGSSTTSTPTMVVKEGVASPTDGVGVLNVQNSAGTSLLFVSGSGRVGIGSSTPDATIHIVGPSFSGFRIGYLGASESYLDSATQYFRDGIGNTFSIMTSTAVRLFTSNTERLRIDSSGNVGIGGTNPKSRLEVTGSTGDNTAAAIHALNASNTSLMFVRNDGNVGIGSISPGTRLDVLTSGQAIAKIASSDSNSAYFSIARSTSTPVGYLGYGAALATDAAATDFVIRSENSLVIASSGNTRRATIDTNGNVGIGISSITARLHVSGSSTASTTTMIVREGVASPTGGVGVLNVQNSAGTSLLFVSGSGNVGVGTNVPDAAFEAVGTIQTRTGLRSNNLGQYSSTNTQIYNDAGAGYAITFVVNGGVERMRIDSSGNVGIGGTNPISRLEVTGSGNTSSTSTMHLVNSSNSTLLFVRDNGTTGFGTTDPGARIDVNTGAASSAYVTPIRLSQTSTASDSGQHILFYNSQQIWEQGALGSLREGANNNFSLTFFTSVGGTNSERVRINSSGNVGIGGTNPKSRLEVTGSTGDNTAAAIHALNASNTSLLYVRNDGNVGIGSTSPDARLDVNDGANGRFRIGGTAGTAIISDFDNFAWRSSNTFTNFAQLNATGLGLGMTTPSSRLFVSGSSTASTTTMIVREGVASPTGGAEVLDVQNSAGTSLFVVSGSGNVGIGTTTFLTNNRVAVFSAAPTSTFDGQLLLSSNTASSAADNGGQLNFQMFDGSSLRGSGFIKSAKENGTASNYSTYMSFGTRNNGDSVNTERLRIDSTGSIGIGTTVAGGRVFITGSTSTSQPAFVVRAGTAVQLDGTKILDILDSSGTGLFHVSGSGDVTVGVGNLVIGTSGKGIDFGATANAPSGTLGQEILDDYEEGSWTPGTTVGGGGTITSTRSGHYTKIGRVVHVKFFIEASAVSGTRTTLTITGLPFQVDVTYTNAWVECYQLNNTGGLTDDFSHGMVWTNATSNSLTFDIYETTSGAPIANPASFVIANTLISGHLTYFTNQ